MSDVSITPANVRMTANSNASVEMAGEAIDAGETVYQNGTEWFLAEAGDTAAKAAASGIAVTSTSGGNKKFVVCISGELEVGAALTANTQYVQSATQGKICPPADLVSGDHVHSVGFAKSTSVLVVKPFSQGFQIT